MKNKLILLMFVGMVSSTIGCAPRVRIHKAPGPTDKGIRYYRPKPYLKIEPINTSTAVTSNNTTRVTTTPGDEFVSISLEYLPDFSEEYSINVTPGLGSATVSVGLENGWNLQTINQELDSQFNENVAALSNLAGSLGSLNVPTSGGDKGDSLGPPAGSTQKFVVPATNVPIGYYESVISADSCGKKRLFGWRYIGFLPFASCPTDMCGSAKLHCQDSPSPLFGLVFENGVMTFKRMDIIPDHVQTQRVPVSTGEYTVAASSEARLRPFVFAVERKILEEYGSQGFVDATLSDDGTEVILDITMRDAEKAEGLDLNSLLKNIATDDLVDTALEELGYPTPRFNRVLGLPPNAEEDADSEESDNDVAHLIEEYPLLSSN